MKTIREILSVAILCASVCLFSCTEDWDNHYNSDKGKEVNNPTITVVDAPILDYLETEESFSEMLQLFQETGTLDTLKKKNQLYTLLVAGNENISEITTPNKDYLAKTHVANVSLSPANLSDGQRVLMWHGKYLNVGKAESEEGIEEISFNGQKVRKIVKLNDGYIYELDGLIEAPQSIYEFIENLGDDYSIFKNLVMSKNDSIFDKANSRPINVDGSGSTVYDSVFIVQNTYFANMGIDLTSESITATLLLPSNAVLEKTMREAQQKLEDWDLLYTEGLRNRADTVVDVWILQAAFYDKKFTRSDFVDNEDLTSVFSRQWRTTVQKVNLDAPIELSNGVVYLVDEMKIPTNVLVYRLKDYMKWYEFMTDEQKTTYFSSYNMVYNNIKTEVTAWSGWPSMGFPYIENRVLFFKQDTLPSPAAPDPYRMDFTPHHCQQIGSSDYEIASYVVPPGEYDLCMGFQQKKSGNVHEFNVSFNGEFVYRITLADQASSNFHYDRSGQGYPEGYDAKKATTPSGKPANYDRDGWKIGVVTIEGDKAVPVTITFDGDASNGATLNLHHWCLKPTKNCY